MPIPLSELLNPAPASRVASPGSKDMPQDDVSHGSTTHEYFAPELFQTNDKQPSNAALHKELPETSLGTQELESGRRESSGTDGDLVTNGASSGSKSYIKSETRNQPVQESSGSDENLTLPSNQDAITQQVIRQDTSDSTGGQMEQYSDGRDMSEQNEGSANGSFSKSKDNSGAPKPRPQKSSTKNEGQHTDKRYLCYICNKLFTRRRSVRDHLSKIHNTKTWEPSRSLEVIVDPTTGEPVEPLEAQLYKIAAKPPPIDEEEAEEPETILPDRSSPPPPSMVTNLKTETSIAGSRASSVENFTTPAPVIGKKRPAPSSASTKKGMARTKNANTLHKKPKLASSEDITDKGIFRSPSATPANIQHKTPASKLKKQSSTSVADSPTPPASSRAESVASNYASADEEGENDNEVPFSAVDTPNTNSDGEVFCICRKGDNHTWMIACDGGCDEWYHGKCVDIRERDGDLIDKYICPSCNLRGVGQTTWKRMCRRKGCRKPARVLHDPPSKYCSADCGRKFFVEMVVKGDEAIGVSKNGQFVLEAAKEKKYRKKRKSGVARPDFEVNGNAVNGHSSRQQTPTSEQNEQSEYETDSSADDDALPNRGGALRAGEVKAIVNKCKTIDDWRQLGKKPLAPPVIQNLDETEDRHGEDRMQFELEVQLDDFERAQLAKLTTQLVKCQQEIELLDAKEKFFDMIKDRSTKITEEVKKSNPKMKDLCGYDPRLAWTEDQFLAWRATDDGISALQSGKLGPPDLIGRTGDSAKRTLNGVSAGEGASDDEEDDNMPTKGGVCVKNRCVRHAKWAKTQLAEVRFEQDVVNKRMERLKREEEGLKGRAVVRMWEVHS